MAIVGTSGSGKSTLMNIIGLLDRPSDGVYQIRGQRADDLTGRQLAELRNSEIGFVFQQFNLLARASAWRQVELPLFYAGVARSASRQRALEALAQVGLADRADHKPEELSGGQTAAGGHRACARQTGPSLLLADEPTGALDTRTGEEVMALFENLHEEGLTLVIITHDQEVADRARRVITMRDGAIISDSPRRLQWAKGARALRRCRGLPQLSRLRRRSMKLVRYFPVAADSIAANKMRASLTMLGIIIGVAAVLSILGIGRGASANILGEVASQGTTRLTINPSTESEGERAGSPVQTLTMGDVKTLSDPAFHPDLPCSRAPIWRQHPAGRRQQQHAGPGDGHDGRLCRCPPAGDGRGPFSDGGRGHADE